MVATLKISAEVPLQWRPQTGRYQYGHDLMLGSIKVGHVVMPTQSQSYTGPRWKPETTLPGIRTSRDRLYETDTEAKAALENVVFNWFTWIGLAPTLGG